MVIAGASLAEHSAAALRAIAKPVLCVGPEAGTSLPSIRDAGAGPLVAFVEGGAWLRREGHAGPVVLLACDMPLITAEALRGLLGVRHGADAVIPIASGKLQPLAAAYSALALERASRLVERGVRSMRELTACLRVEVVPASVLGVTDEAFDDIDTPADAERITSLL